LWRKKIIAASNDNRTTAPAAASRPAAFSKSETEMNATIQLKILSDKIADAIVDLVNDTDGPITLSRVDREVPGFASVELSSWDYLIEHPQKKHLIWSGMSEAGYVALCKVISGRRVAIQFVNMLPYILEGCLLKDNDWLPSVLVPAKAANLAAPSRLIRTSEGARRHILARAAVDKKAGYRMLTPRSTRFSADSFCLGGW
jgi:hypothetical protein